MSQNETFLVWRYFYTSGHKKGGSQRILKPLFLMDYQKKQAFLVAVDRLSKASGVVFDRLSNNLIAFDTFKAFTRAKKYYQILFDGI